MDTGDMLTWSLFIACVLLFDVKTAFASKHVKARVGETAILPCRFNHATHDPPPFVIEWSQNVDTLPIYIQIGRYPARINSRFQGRSSLVRNSASLRIRDVRLEDEGWYVCRILYLGNVLPEDYVKRNGTRIKLVVTARPVITSAPPGSMVLEINDTLRLRCSIKGKPEPEVTWKKDGVLLSNKQDRVVIKGGRLSLLSVQKKHRGRYQCVGRNSEGQIDYLTRVYVKAPPELTVVPKNLTLKENVDAFFTCRATAYPTNITYRWFYNGIPVENVASLGARYNVISDGTFDIYNVNKHDSGQIACEASNGYGEPVKSTAYLTVQYQARALTMPRVVYGGLLLPVTLPCKSEGEPPANTITWKKNGAVLTTSSNGRTTVTADGSLHIRSMLEFDEGAYTCTPYNILGSAGESGEMNLMAKEPPKFTLQPEKEIEAEMGKPLTLLCDGEGDPKPSFTWQKVGDTLKPDRRVFSSGGNLTITSVKKEDHGMWLCVLKNAVTELTSGIQINVKYTTPHMPYNVTISTTHNSAHVSWLPGYDGGYPQHFMIWYKRADQGDHMWLTRSVNGSRTSVLVSRLQNEQVYQFAVLAENVLGSGKFSKTITSRTEALPTTAPVREHNEIPAPYGLQYCANNKGLIVVSWKTSSKLSFENLLGFLVEFRKSKISTISDRYPSKCEFQSKEKRSITARNKESVNFEEKNQPSMESLSANENNQWQQLAAYPANTSKIEIDSKMLHQNELYEIHVLAVTSSAYSPSSDSVMVDTKGMAAYRESVSNKANYAVLLSGIIAGILFVVIAVLITVRFLCLRQRKYKRDATVSPTIFNNSMPLENMDKKATATSCQSSHVTLQTATTSKCTSNEHFVEKKKKGVFQKLKRKFGKNKRKTDSRAQSLIHSGYLNGPSDTVKNSPFEKLGPIYRSPDGKFHLSDSNYSNEAISSANKRKSAGVDRNRDDLGCEISLNDRRKKANRPISDSFAVNDGLGLGNMIPTKTPEIEVYGEVEGPSLEIDCSQSDIEVRIVSNERNFSVVPPNFVSPPIYDLPTPNNLSSNYTMASYLSNQPMRSRMSIAQANPISGPVSPFFPPAEYVYLRDIGIRSTDTPISELTRSSLCFSPPLNMVAPHNLPVPHPRFKYHSHALAPGGHYPITPSRASFASPSSRKWNPTSPIAPPPLAHQEYGQKRYPSIPVSQNHVGNTTNPKFQPPIFKSAKYNNKKSPSVGEGNSQRLNEGVTHSNTPATQNAPDITAGVKCPSVEYKNTNNNAIPSPAHLSPSSRSHSQSLPILAHRKVIGAKEKSRKYARKFASIDDFTTRSDTESDRGFSFASGSASTVRYMASKESNLAASRDEITSHSPHLTHPAVRLHPSHGSEKSRSSASSSVLPSDVGGGSCSGYESQNTSSDTSSHCMKLRNSSKTLSDQIRHNHQSANVYHPNSNHNHEFRDRQTTHGCHNNLNPPRVFLTSAARGSAASSEELRSRRDISSVDDKYEWDSEFAMESEILEALKNFESHPSRDRPVFQNLLQELRSWRAKKQQLTSSSTDTSSPFSLNYVFDETEWDKEDDGLLSPLSDSSYSKEKMEKRCALLKKEYLNYKRWIHSQQNTDFSSPQSHC